MFYSLLRLPLSAIAAVTADTNIHCEMKHKYLVYNPPRIRSTIDRRSYPSADTISYVTDVLLFTLDTYVLRYLRLLIGRVSIVVVVFTLNRPFYPLK